MYNKNFYKIKKKEEKTNKKRKKKRKTRTDATKPGNFCRSASKLTHVLPRP